MQQMQFFYLKAALDILPVQQVYKEAYAITHIDAKLKEDPLVNKVLDIKHEREDKFKKKQVVILETSMI